MEGTALRLVTSRFQESHQELQVDAEISDQDQMWDGHFTPENAKAAYLSQPHRRFAVSASRC